jgi:hypothetical protein
MSPAGNADVVADAVHAPMSPLAPSVSLMSALVGWPGPISGLGPP